MKPSPLVFALLLASGLLSCAPQSPPPAQSPVSRAPAQEAPRPTPEAVVPPVPTTTAPRPAPTRPFDESLLRGREFLLEVQTSRHPALRDADLGELSRDAVQVKAIEDFFRDAADGNLEPSGVEERWYPYLNQWAKTFQRQNGAGARVRVGVALPSEEGVVLVPVRLAVKEKDYSGWIALVSDGKGYRVSDVQIVEAPPRTGPYDPESPRS